MFSSLLYRGGRRGQSRGTQTGWAAVIAFFLIATSCNGQDGTHWSGRCEITYQGVTQTTPCLSEDGGRPTGVWNWWVLTVGIPLRPYSNLATWVRQDLQEDGSLLVNYLLWGSIKVTPIDPAFREQLKASYKQLNGMTWETRAQVLTITSYGNYSVIQAIETTQDSDGFSPTKDWLDRFAMAWLQHGGAKHLQ